MSLGGKAFERLERKVIMETVTGTGGFFSGGVLRRTIVISEEGYFKSPCVDGTTVLSYTSDL